MQSDEIVLVNAACVQDGDRLGVLVNLYRRPRGGGKSELRCTVARWDSEAGWGRTLDGLHLLEPAKPFTLDMVGVGDERLKGLEVSDHGTHLLTLNALKRLKGLVMRKIPVEVLRAKNRGLGGNLEYLLEFDGTDLCEIADSDWHVATRERPPKRRPKRVIY